MGQSISLAHLSPFVESTRQTLKRKHPEYSDKQIEELVLDDVQAGVQTIQYQVVTLMTTNGQAPFITVYMNLGEVEEGKDREDLALVIEEVLKQRILGTKNEKGVYVTPAFPKLIYALDDFNISEDSKYWYLTELSAKCTAKRMVPDYISNKVMRELKGGDVYTCMGCVDGEEIITYKFQGRLYVEAFSRMWNRFSMIFQVKHQYTEDNPNLYIDLDMVQIYDTNRGAFTECKRIIRNVSDKWVDVNFSGGRRLLCTVDHPLEVIGKGFTYAGQLQPGDKILANYNQYNEYNFNVDPEYAWTLGMIICDGSYNGTITVSIALNGEDEIEERYIRNMKTFFNIDVKTLVRMRGQKGNYKDLCSVSRKEGEVVSAINQFEEMFGGIQKVYRQIPNEVFEWCYSAKLAFMAGLIDADGYINNSKRENNPNIHQDSRVQLGSTNKEFALQQMALAQSLGMKALIYHNHYNSSKPDAIRYRVEFIPSTDLVNFVSCSKKREKFICSPITFNGFIPVDNIVEVRDVIPVYKTDFSYDVTTESEHFEVSGLYSHNCRSFLTPDRFTDTGIGNISRAKNYEEGKHKYYGRFNTGVVTINLPYIALLSEKDEDKFWDLLEKYCELCHTGLQTRHKRLRGTLSDVAPILWQYGALARLDKGETIDELLYHGYSTISLGYAGIYEMTKYMTGESHISSDKGKEFAIKVMQFLNDKCAAWKKEENIDYSVYGTPIESVTYKFAKANQRDFGVIEDVTDHGYVTNSYHCCVREEIDAFSKLAKEAEFQKLSPGGAISYIEVPNMQNNIPAVLSVIKFIYEHIMYAELNTKSDYCQVCGFDGEIKIEEDPETKKLYWKCPNCGNTDQSKMNVARRTCGLT